MTKKLTVCFLSLFLVLGLEIGVQKEINFAYTKPLITNSGIIYPISLRTGIDAGGNKVFLDNEFLSYIKQEKFLTGKYEGYAFDLDEDGFLSKEECETVRVLSLSGRTEIQSLQGLEAFPKLRELYCNGTSIRSINLSYNPRLQILTCSDTPLQSIDISKCPLLRELKLSNCQLSCLQLAENKALSFLTCQNQNREVGEYRENGRYLVQLTDLDANIDLNRVSDVKIDGVSGDGIHSGYDRKTGLVYCSDEMRQISYVYTFSYGGTIGDGVDLEMQVTLPLTTGIRESYDTGEGSRVLPQFFLAGEKDGEPESPKRDGYQFTGWYTDSFRTKPYHFGNIMNDNTILYAGWKKKEYKVFYQSEAKKWERSSTVDWWTANLTPPKEEIPVRNGYTLVGWQTESGRFITKAQEAVITFGDASGDSNVEETTLQAIWKENNGYQLNLEMVLPAHLRKQVENMPISRAGTSFAWSDSNLLSTLSVPKLAGHQFAGWFTAKSGGIQVTRDMTYQTLYEAQFGNTAGDIHIPTLYGRFIPTNYTVFYHVCGGSRVAAKQNVLWGSSGLLPAKNPKKKGYIFAGWKLDDKKITNKTKLNQDKYKYTNSLILKAIWFKKYEQKGKIFRRYGYVYKVTKSNKKGNCVKLLKVTKKKAVIRNKVFLNGKYFKLVSIQKKALKKIKKIRIKVPKKMRKKYRRMAKKAGGKKL